MHRCLVDGMRALLIWSACWPGWAADVAKDQPPPYLTNHPKTSPLGCIGEPVTPLCSALTVFAGDIWDYGFLSRRAGISSAFLDNGVFWSSKSGDIEWYIGYWIEKYSSGQEARGEKPSPGHPD